MAHRRKASGAETAPRVAAGTAALDAAMTGAAGTVAGALALGVAQPTAALAEEVRETMAAIVPAEKDGRDGGRSGEGTGRVTDDAAAEAPPTASQKPDPAPPHPAAVQGEGGDGRPDAAGEARPASRPAAEAEGEAAPEGMADASVGDEIARPAAASGGAGTGDAATGPLDAEAIAGRISEQIGSAIDRIAQGIEGGGQAEFAELGRSIAQEIAETAAAIVSDIEAALPAASLGEDIRAAVETAILPQASSDAVEALPDAIGAIETLATAPSSLADTIAEIRLPEPADVVLPAADIGSLLASLPSPLLGAESDGGPDGGLLSSLFYSDGEAESPIAEAAQTAMSEAETVMPDDGAAAMPDARPAPDDLSDAAAGIEAAVGAVTVDLVGLSYADAGDLPYSGMQSGLGALHVV